MGISRSSPQRRRLLRRLSAEQNHKCACCGDLTNEIENHPKAASIERVKPAVLGGRYSYDNCVMYCRECNSNEGGEMGRTIRDMLGIDHRAIGAKEAVAEAIKTGKLDPTQFYYCEAA